MKLLYEGPSVIDGGPIVALLTGDDKPSSNAKTGPMAQTWILRQDVLPTYALKTGLDRSVCGDCPHRKGTCYVNVGQGPNNVYRKYARGEYSEANRKLVGRNRVIRLGAYGDPGAVPIYVWEELLQYADAWTGYTHQPLLQPDLKKFCQASADTESEAKLYQNLGWKTFRIKKETEPLQDKEIICPSPAVQCITCRQCNGKAQNVAIDVHGLNWKIKRYEEYRNEVMELQQSNNVRELSTEVEA